MRRSSTAESVMIVLLSDKTIREFCVIVSYKFLLLQLWDQDIAPLKRSLSSNSRRLSRISQLALVNLFIYFLYVFRNRALITCDGG